MTEIHFHFHPCALQVCRTISVLIALQRWCCAVEADRPNIALGSLIGAGVSHRSCLVLIVHNLPDACLYEQLGALIAWEHCHVHLLHMQDPDQLSCIYLAGSGAEGAAWLPHSRVNTCIQDMQRSWHAQCCAMTCDSARSRCASRVALTAPWREAVFLLRIALSSAWQT